MASVVQFVPQPAFFDDFHPKYKCCCSCCHVKVGTLVLGILTAFGLLFVPYSLIARAASVEPIAEQYDVSPTVLLIPLYGAVAVSAFEVIAVVCLFVGLAKERASLLLPYSILIGLRMAGSFICAVIFGILACLGKEIQEFVTGVLVQGGNTEITPEMQESISSMASVLCVSVAIGFVIAGLIEIWFFTVVRGCSRYFKDKAAFNSRHTVEAGYNAQPQNFNYKQMK